MIGEWLSRRTYKERLLAELRRANDIAQAAQDRTDNLGNCSYSTVYVDDDRVRLRARTTHDASHRDSPLRRPGAPKWI